MVSGTNRAKLSVWDGSGPKLGLNVMLPVKPPLEFQLHLTLLTVDAGGKLPPSLCTQEKAGTNLASPDEKIPPHFSMPWALPISRSSISL